MRRRLALPTWCAGVPAARDLMENLSLSVPDLLQVSVLSCARRAPRVLINFSRLPEWKLTESRD